MFLKIAVKIYRFILNLAFFILPLTLSQKATQQDVEPVILNSTFGFSLTRKGWGEGVEGWVEAKFTLKILP